MIDRRDFIRESALAATASVALLGQARKRVVIQPAVEGSYRRKLAERELLRGLRKLHFDADFGDSGDIRLMLRVEPGKFRNAEAYSIASESGQVTLSAAGEQALLHAVFDFLERQGAFFGIDGDTYPLDAPGTLVLPPPNQPWSATPRFAVRGLVPWPDFLNSITVYNEEDFRAYFEGMLRMRFNTFGMHVYTGESQLVESYLSYEFAGAGHLAFLDTTASRRWGYLPQRTSSFGMGASQLYDSEVFGGDNARFSRDPWEAAERARKLLRDAFSYAARLGLRTGIGFEPYQIPDEILRALPPEVKPKDEPGVPRSGARFDIESVTAKKMLEARLAQLLEAYPEVTYVWLWEDEIMGGDSRQRGIPLSVAPFLQAHDFLRRHAPQKRLVLAGWGGVARHYEDFHRRLPMDIIFSCLSDTVGWDPVHEVFGKIDGRERWPVLWLEDDTEMWQMQQHVHRLEKDIKRAHDFGCQGLMGIHWRHRIVDINAAFQSRYSWDARLSPADYYRAYARVQAGGPRSGPLATLLEDSDRNRKLLSSFTGSFKDGHAQVHSFSGEYSEAFRFSSGFDPPPAVVESQKQVAAALRELVEAARSPFEKERLEYLTGHVEFLVSYADCWVLAHRLHVILRAAGELKTSANVEAAREKVRTLGVPVWLELAPKVRQAMLHFQRIVATRSDLGTLASKHNKFVRLALVRLRLSMQEYLGELPPETEKAFAEATRPDSQAPARVFLPTRPSVLGKGEKLRMYIVAPGSGSAGPVTLHARARKASEWTVTPAKLVGRKTYAVTLGPFPPDAELVDYYVSSGGLTAPPDAPREVYTVTVV